MPDSLANHAFVPKVAIARLPSASYPDGSESDNPLSQAMGRLGTAMDWANENGPFGKVIPKGARVLIKPNLVSHRNEGTGGIICLVTHASVIRAAVEAALRSQAAEVLVGDAPVQGCDLPTLLEGTGLRAWVDEQVKRELRFKGLRDFRRTTCTFVKGVRVAKDNLRPEERYCFFDLGRESHLEPLSNRENRFRVAWYDHRVLAKAHRPGVHRYVIAREVIDADVVINLPKLKIHRKAGITCALKNLVGMNGNKDFLPHHRLGGAAEGGDNYPGRDALRRTLEFIRDRQNIASSYAVGKAWNTLATVLIRSSRLMGDNIGTDGSWNGNDTVWRMVLDLNRILLYGRPDGTLGDEIQRRVIHLADGVVAGQNKGPLAPDPLELGLLLGGNCSPAVDWVGAQLLGLNPARVSLTRHAFDQFRWPLTNFSGSDVRLVGDLGEGSPESLLDAVRKPVIHPAGWDDSVLEPQIHEVAPRPRAVKVTSPVSHWDA